MKSKIIVLAFICIALTFVGCGKSNESDNSDTYVEIEKDSNTIHKNNVFDIEKDYQEEKQEEKEESYNVVDPSINVGELSLQGTDSSVNWEIQGNDVVYNGVRFRDLYNCVQHLDLPCEQNTFINFIVKTLNTTTDVDCGYTNEKEFVYDEESTDIAIDFVLEDSDVYKKIKEKYDNTPANWTLTIFSGSSNLMIYGCDRYLVYDGAEDLVTVDMSEYSLDNVDTNGNTDISENSITESTDNTEDSDENSIDDTVDTTDNSTDVLNEE